MKTRDKPIRVEVIRTSTDEELSKRFTEACLEVLQKAKELRVIE